MSEEWGPWIEHDGKGYPEGVIGRICQVFDVCCVDGIMGPSEPFLCCGSYDDGGSWNWDHFPEVTMVIRYRIRKPRGMTILEELIADLPEEVDA